MTVLELKKMLGKYPDDMEVVNMRCSDWDVIIENEWSVIDGVEKEHWVMRSHPTMSEENKLKEKKYLALMGN